MVHAHPLVLLLRTDDSYWLLNGVMGSALLTLKSDPQMGLQSPPSELRVWPLNYSSC